MAFSDLEVSSRTDGTIAPYTGSSGYKYNIGSMIIKGGSNMSVIQPATQGAGASNARFLGIMRNHVDLTAGLGSSQATLDIFQSGIFTLASVGTGVSTDIGQRAYATDEQTVGISVGLPCTFVGTITGLGNDTSHYRVYINPAIGTFNPQGYTAGISGFSAQN